MASFMLISNTYHRGIGFSLQDIFKSTFGSDDRATNCSVGFMVRNNAQIFCAKSVSVEPKAVKEFVKKFDELRFIWADILVYVVAGEHQQSLITVYTPKGKYLSKYLTGVNLERELRRSLPQDGVSVKYSRGYLTVSVVTSDGDVEKYQRVIDDIVGSRAKLYAASLA